METRVISQAAFDEVVRENMTELDMNVDEAIEDAVQQFEAQHVNLANIVKDMVRVSDAQGRHPVMAAIEAISTALDESSELNADVVLPQLAEVRDQCAVDLAHRCLAGRRGQEVLFMALIRALDVHNADVVDAALCAMTALLNTQPDVIANSELNSLVHLLEKKPDTAWLSEAQITQVCAVLRLACFMHEGNRQTLVSQGVIPLAVALLGEEEAVQAPGRGLVSEVCRLLRGLTMDDDPRVPFSKAHEHAKHIVTETPALGMLLTTCRKFKEVDDQDVVAETFVTLSKLSVRNEFCQQLLDCGGVALIFESLSNHIQNQQIVRSSMLLIKSLAGNDNVKKEVCRCGGIALMAQALQEHVENAGCAQNGCGAFGAVCLRQTEAAKAAAAAHVPAIFAQILKVHAEKPEVLRPACLAVRNMVSRAEDVRPIFLKEHDFEALLKKIYHHCPEEAKSALRDLGCEIALNEPWTGKMGHIADN